jgi:hypothetical protein
VAALRGGRQRGRVQVTATSIHGDPGAMPPATAAGAYDQARLQSVYAAKLAPPRRGPSSATAARRCAAVEPATA